MLFRRRASEVKRVLPAGNTATRGFWVLLAGRVVLLSL